MRKHILYIAMAMLASGTTAYADIDITDLYMTNAGFDDSEYFDYRKGETGNVAQEILNVCGWAKDINVDYTITGVYEYGTGKTFNTYGKVPSAGYQNSQGGCLALSTGWEQSMKFYQEVSLPKGKYKIQTAFYNGSNSQSGFSELAWIADNGTSKLSELSSFPINQWTLDEVQFSVDGDTKGRIQIGLRAVEGGSANSAKVVSDFVKLFLVGDDAALYSDMKNTLLSTLQTAEELYSDGSGNKAGQLKTAIDNCKKTTENNNSSYSDLFLANNNLNSEITLYKWANSTKDNPISFTDRILNPSFENGLNGWTQNGFKTQNNTSFVKKSGSVYVEKWVSNGSTVGNISIKQEITDLPIGNYTLTVGAQNLQDGVGATGAYLFAGDEKTEVSDAKDYTLNFTLLDETLSIGIYTDNVTGNWVAADNFRLSYYSASEEDMVNEIQRQVAIANDLLGKTMCQDHRKSLSEATKEADTWTKNPDESTVSYIYKNIKYAILSARTSSDAYSRLSYTIDEANTLIQENGTGTNELKKSVANAESIYSDETLTISDINSATKELQTAILIYKTENSNGDIPKVTASPLYARGATMFFGRAEFDGNDIIERGFCWSERPNPGITDNRSTLTYQNNGSIYVIEGLNPSTFYYMRPYAISSSYAVGYGDEIKICTLPFGEITWQYNNGGSADENQRINDAVADAVDIWNNLTSIKGLHLNVNYGAQTPTADCSYGGWMRVGPNASYQSTGTIQHEMCHAAGVGTTSRWYDDATYREETSKGIWLGERTDKVLQFLENDMSAHLKGDKTHFWPYGVNGAHEDDGTRILYYANALIIQSLGEDNLPPVSGAFASAAYTFTQDDEEDYYIIPADFSGTNINLLRGNGDALTITKTDWKSALKNHSFAWHIKFNPSTQLYSLTNSESGLSINVNNGWISLSDKEEYGLQMLGSRENISAQDFNLKSYWFVLADGTDKPNALSYNGLNVSKSQFDHRNSATTQRWIIVSRSEAKALAGDLSELSEISTNNHNIRITGCAGGIEIETYDKGGLAEITDISGCILKRVYLQVSMRIFVQLPQGIYIVNGIKVMVGK